MNVLGWIISLFAGCLDGQLRIVLKRSQAPLLPFLLIAETVASALLAVPLAISGIPVIKPLFWVCLMIVGPLLAVGLGLVGTAAKISSISVVGVYMCLTPTFMLLVAPILHQARPTSLGVLGILVTTAGIYTLNMESARERWSVPIVRALSDRGGRMMIAVAALYAFTANVFAIGIDNSSGPAYAFGAHCSMFLTLLCWCWWKQGFQFWRELRGRWTDCIKGGMCIGLSDIALPLAYSHLSVMTLVIIGKRTGQTLYGSVVAMLLGGPLPPGHGSRFADERRAVGFRLLGACLCLLGMTIVILWGKR